MVPVSVPSEAEPVDAKLKLVYSPVAPSTLNTIYGEASLTVTGAMVKGRSSVGSLLASAGLTTVPVTGVTLCTVAGEVGVDRVTPSTVLVVTNTVPEPSSLMVPRPTSPAPLVLVAVKVKVSPAATSDVVSLVIATRTNKLATSPVVVSPSDGICTKLPAV